jgi:hypothetical protein
VENLNSVRLHRIFCEQHASLRTLEVLSELWSVRQVVALQNFLPLFIEQPLPRVLELLQVLLVLKAVGYHPLRSSRFLHNGQQVLFVLLFQQLNSGVESRDVRLNLLARVPDLH